MNDPLWIELMGLKGLVEKIRTDLKVSLTWASMNGRREADRLILTIDKISTG